VQSENSLYAYQNYVSYELRAKQPDLDILSNIHERAIAEAAKRRAVGEVGAEEALRLWWTSYVDSMVRLSIAHPTYLIKSRLSAETERCTSGTTTLFVSTFHKECTR
jgi:hypothetical protein